MNEKDIEITKRHYAIYHISGDSGVDGRGTFLFQCDTFEEFDKFLDDIGSMNDDRCNAKVLHTNVNYAELKLELEEGDKK